MRIVKLLHEVDEEDEVQIIYETPSDEDCLFIEEKVVNPPTSQSSFSPKASCSRTSVITGRKRPAEDPLLISRRTAIFKRPALQDNWDELEYPFPDQPTTSQQSGESTLQGSSLWQQPSTSKETTTAEQLPLDLDEQDSESVTSVVRVANPIYLLSSRLNKSARVFSENENQSGCFGTSRFGKTNLQQIEIPKISLFKKEWLQQLARSDSQAFEQSNNEASDSISPTEIVNEQDEFAQLAQRGNETRFCPTKFLNRCERSRIFVQQAINKITQPNIHSMPKVNVVRSDNISSAAPNHQQLAVTTATQSNNVSIPQTNDNIPMTAHTSQQLQIFEEQTVDMTPDPWPVIHEFQENDLSSDSVIQSQALIHQQETQQQAMSTTTQPNIYPIQERINVEDAPDSHLQTLVDEQQEIFDQDNLRETTQSNVNTLQESIDIASEIDNSSDPYIDEQISYRTIIQSIKMDLERIIGQYDAEQIQEMDGTNINTAQENIGVTNDTEQPRASKLTIPQRQIQFRFPKFNPADSIHRWISDNSTALSNKLSEVISPLDLTQPGDLQAPTLSGIFKPFSSRISAKQHLVWQGTMKTHTKQIFSPLTQLVECYIYGIKTSSGNMNVNADFWPRHLVLLLLPYDLLYKQGLLQDLKSIDRHAIIYFNNEWNYVKELQKSMASGLMGFIQFPSPCQRDKMIVLYLKPVFIGFIINNDSAFNTKFTQVRRDHNQEMQQTQRLMPSGSLHSQTPSQPTNLPQSTHQQRSLPQSAHQQVGLIQSSPQLTSLPLPAHQQAGFPLPLHQQTSLPQSSCQTNLPHLPTHLFPSIPLQSNLSQSSNLQACLPQSSHLQTSLPQPSHLQTSLPPHLQLLLPKSSTALSCLPVVQAQRFVFKLANSVSKQISNKYETVDRHIDACISAIHQRNQLSEGAGPSTSQQSQALYHQFRIPDVLKRRQDSGTSNGTLLLTSGVTNSQAASSSWLLRSKLDEIRVGEIFSPSLVKKVIKGRFKTTGKPFESADELCEACLEYEDSNRKKSKESKKSKKDVTEALLCKICMDEQMNVVCEPCGHLSTCLNCSEPLQKCPICRSLITNKRKIYLS